MVMSDRPTDRNGDPIREGTRYEGTSRALTFVCRAEKRDGEWVPVPADEHSKSYEHMLYRWDWRRARPINDT